MRDAVGLSTDIKNPILAESLLAASESTSSETNTWRSIDDPSVKNKNKKIVLAASGTRGDVQPYIALGN